MARKWLGNRVTWLLAVLLASCAQFAAGQDTGSLSGVVRDAGKVPVVGATVTVSAAGNPERKAKTITDERGVYRFEGLTPGPYAAVVDAPAFVGITREVVVPVPETSLDFDLIPASAAPKFEAAGVRGLIDQGGYSAPAAAASASSMVTGMAEMQRRSTVFTTDWPCSLEPELKRASAQSGSAETQLRLGEFYLAHGRYNDAAEHLTLATEKQPDTRSYNLLAQAYERSGLFLNAAQAYRISAKLQPTEENLFGEGYEWILSGSAELAATAFRRALTQRPESFGLWTGSGAAEFLAGHADRAVDAFLHAIGLNPTQPETYNFLEKAIEGGGGTSRRVEDAFRNFALISSQDARAVCYYALSLDRQDPSDPRVEALLERAAVLDPNSAEAHFELAAFLAKKGDNMKAIRQYEETITLDPNLARAHYRLAQAYRSAGEQQKAARELSTFQSLKSRDRSTDSGVDLGSFLSVFKRNGEKYDAAVNCLEPATK